MNKNKRRQKRITRVRGKIFGTKSRPRLAVFRSNKYIYAQLIDDEGKVTLASATSLQTDSKVKMEAATKTGEKLAENAKKQKISEVVFDRRGYRYHGRVKALAEGARKGGLIF